MFSQFTMPYPPEKAVENTKHDCQKDMSSTDRSDKNHHSQEKGTPSLSSGSVYSLDAESNDTQDTDPSSRHKGSEDSISKAASNESSFQPCLICKLDGFVSPSLRKFVKAGAAAPCPNENSASNEVQDEDEFEVVDHKEAMEGDQDDQDDHMVMIEDLDDDYLQV